MSLRAKILIGFSSILALVILIWVWAILHLYWLGHASDAILRENYRSILAAENMIDAIERQDSATLLMLLEQENTASTQFRIYELEFVQWLRRAKDNITIEGEAEILATIQASYVDYLTAVAQLRVLQATDAEAALAHYHETVAPLFQQARNESIHLRDLNQETMTAASNQARVLATRAIWSTVGVGLAAALAGLAFSFWLSRLIAQPLQAMSAAADRIAEGNYDVQLPTDSGDELGHLADKIMTMSNKLKTFHRLNVGKVITEKRRSEAIINAITDGLVVVDADLQIIAINPKAAAIWATTPEAAQGHHVFDVVEDQQLYERLKTCARSCRAPSLNEEEMLYIHERNGHADYYRYTITPVKTEFGPLEGVVLLLQDITKLKELDKLKSDFVMTASHELRTPLTSIAMSIDLLQGSAAEKLTSREKELLAAADEETQRLRALVNNLLDLSKIESGRMEMELRPVEVPALVGQAVSLLSMQANERQIELTAQVAPDIGAVTADPTKIIWVLTNLIGNALRFTDPGGHLCVSARQQGDYAYFAVTDDGVGIPLEYQSKIFDKFVQVNDNRSIGGTGLGLAISKEIVKAHGGVIWVTSKPGEGSTFTFTLPLAAARPKAVGVNHDYHEYRETEDSHRRRREEHSSHLNPHAGDGRV